MTRKHKFPVIQTGTTSDGKPVYAGVYKFYETYGLPLDVILTTFQQKGWVPDWIDLYIDAIKAGMEHDRIISKLDEAISDSYGKQWSDEVILRLTNLFRPQDFK
jgi:hypothetical protein